MNRTRKTKRTVHENTNCTRPVYEWVTKVCHKQAIVDAKAAAEAAKAAEDGSDYNQKIIIRREVKENRGQEKDSLDTKKISIFNRTNYRTFLRVVSSTFHSIENTYLFRV